ncbi:PQQ-dependent sugar dehydrogenase [Thioalkalivibrio paradoxus]|uniref:Aldose sugar dehydrogenase YliI n=1 Tax=Thioalkalivibrio paradoxus ARh 1 TaxID=713585 RepID=W0DHA3_9GAMM|nr:PQQ-dependent sugar dehydrogenase [Thioalkalivibrio paradoxus]AHE98014.1 aldose sugar dehydrogenase YliI [Thioalkalivibrio paradoxus ARh 1]
MHPLNRLAILSTAVSLLFANAACASETVNSEYQSLRLVNVVDGLDHVWAFAFLPNGDLLVTERSGNLSRIRDGSALAVSGAPAVTARGQGGLLDVSLHPDFATNRLVYLTYSRSNPDSPGETAVALARGELDGLRLENVEEIFVQNRYSGPGRHYGSRLAWLPDGTLLMSVGDRGSDPPRAQDLGDHAGSLLRLNDDGSVPDDNPFVNRDDAAPEIYATGLRNIQGLMVHPDTGEIWATDHGPRGGDELNRIEAGENYGWPKVSLGVNYRTQEPYFDYTVRHKEGMVDPVIDWTPSLAVSGLAALPEDSRYAGQWSGNFLAGGLRSQQLRRVVFRDGIPVHEEELIRGSLGRIRDVRVGPDGILHVATDNGGGRDGIWRLEPAR